MPAFRDLEPKRQLTVAAGAMFGVGVLLVIASRGQELFVVCAIVLFLVGLALLIRAAGWWRRS